MQLGLTDHVLVVLVGFFALAPLIWTASLPRELESSNSASSLAALELNPGGIGLHQPDHPQPLGSTQTRRRRSYKTDGDAYIRFGKRTQSMDQPKDLPFAEGRSLNPQVSRRSPAEQSYIRFGKRASKIPIIPCTLAFLRVLKTSKERIDHLHECSKYRGIHRRSEDDGYIRFGKRNGNSSTEKEVMSGLSISDGATQKCFFIPREASDDFTGSGTPNSVFQDCSKITPADLEDSVIIYFV
ncbi:hypothetical protein TCAL_01688 [Tigriopus californicus]|uniref:Uncharacterized protein n=1 Tax=Tigriopus californicus TaxID=6832 RepID=A0A553PJD5_TIGCA|nr:uncharacterized protein LOC131890360 [Tigriopus californicus]TRY77778.1 hypothetical protein TCAL_01688 [Tigriopus californicus]